MKVPGKFRFSLLVSGCLLAMACPSVPALSAVATAESYITFNPADIRLEGPVLGYAERIGERVQAWGSYGKTSVVKSKDNLSETPLAVGIDRNRGNARAFSDSIDEITAGSKIAINTRDSSSRFVGQTRVDLNFVLYEISSAMTARMELPVTYTKLSSSSLRPGDVRGYTYASVRLDGFVSQGGEETGVVNRVLYFQDSTASYRDTSASEIQKTLAFSFDLAPGYSVNELKLRAWTSAIGYTVPLPAAWLFFVPGLAGLALLRLRATSRNTASGT